MRKITALDNPEIKKIVTLHTPKGRQLHRSFIAEGWRTISTLIAGKMVLQALYITEDVFETAQETFPKNEFTLVAQSVMKKISQAATPSGVLAVFASRQNPPSTEMNSGLVLANITDPGNMGTLIRTAVAINIKTVIIVEGVDPWSHKVIQATAGTIAQINVFQMGWQHMLHSKDTLKLYALIPSGGKNIEKTKCSDGLLVIGNEAHGLPEEWAVQCEEQITIPMPGKAESLNAAVAGSIAAYLAFGRKPEDVQASSLTKSTVTSPTAKSLPKPLKAKTGMAEVDLARLAAFDEELKTYIKKAEAPYERRRDYPTRSKTESPHERKRDYPVRSKIEDSRERRSDYPVRSKSEDPRDRKRDYPTRSKTGDSHERRRDYPVRSKSEDPRERRRDYPTKSKTEKPHDRKRDYPAKSKTKDQRERKRTYTKTWPK